LASAQFDVALVDVLYVPILESLEDERRRGAISAGTGPFFESGLAVLDAIETQQPIPAAIWSEGDDNRLLHMIYAFQRFNVGNFYRKFQVGTALLDRAIKQTTSGIRYIDKGLQQSGVGAAWLPLDKTLFAEPEWPVIWRALALGATSHKKIQEKVKIHIGKYRREVIGAMAQAADNMSSVSEYDGDALGFCAMFAARQRTFLLDATIKKHFP